MIDVENIIENESVVKVYSVPECNLAKLTDGIAKLNKRAARTGCAPIQFKVEFDCVKKRVAYNSNDGNKVVWMTDEEYKESCERVSKHTKKQYYFPTGESMPWNKVTVEGVNPKFNGWKLIAALEPLVTDDGVAKNIIKTVPGCECPASQAQRIGECDHCKKKRNRHKTLVLEHEDGQYKVVGRQCIADFLGGKSAEQLAAMAEWLCAMDDLCEEAEEYDGGCGGHIYGFPLMELLIHTAAIIEIDGWLSRGAAEYDGGIATADKVLRTLPGPGPFDPEWAKELRFKIADLFKEEIGEGKTKYDEFEATAAAAIAWAKAIPDEEENSYLVNCKIIAETASFCRSKNAGIGCSIVSAYLREQEKLKVAALKAKLPPSQHVGKVGERLVLTLTIDAIYHSEGFYGTTAIHKMHDANGNIFTWFASCGAFAVDETVTVKGTVKKHDDYKGTKQTVLSRVAEYVEKPKKSRKKKVENEQVSESVPG